MALVDFEFFKIFNGKICGSVIIGIWGREISTPCVKVWLNPNVFHWIWTEFVGCSIVEHYHTIVPWYNRYGEPQLWMARNNHGIIDFFRLLNGSVSQKSISRVNDDPPKSHKFVKKKFNRAVKRVLSRWFIAQFNLNSISLQICVNREVLEGKLSLVQGATGRWRCDAAEPLREFVVCGAPIGR